MTEKKPLNDPTNRVVATFEDPRDAQTARLALRSQGLANDQVRYFEGPDDAEEIETSWNWFADTATEIKRFKRALSVGNGVLSVAVSDGEQREEIHKVLTEHNASLITHFGQWVTETLSG